MYKNLGSRIKFYWKTIEHTLNIILAHTLNVILGFIPRIHAKHSSLLDTRVEPEDDNRMRIFFKPKYDGERSLIKGLDVVRQCAAILERRVQKEYTSAKISSRHRLNEFSQNNLRPQCAPDTTGFLSDVYKRGTRAQKFLVDGVQCGRSMIEMLGVLAIIGVLSVGGIAGYSKAMITFTTNTLLQQISTIISNTKILCAQQKDYSGIYDKQAIQIGIIPEELISSDGETLVDSFGDQLFFVPYGTEDKAMEGFSIMSSMSTKEKCLAMSNADWNVFNPYGVYIASPNGKSLFYCSDRYLEINGEGACDEMGKVVKKLPFSPSDIAEICSSCSVEKPCDFELVTE